MKVSESKYIFLILYVDDILLVANNTDLLVETKQLLFSYFDIKDLGKAFYVLGIQILCHKTSVIVRLFQQTYIEFIMKRFNMQSRSSGKTPIVKGNKFSKDQCPQNDIEGDQMIAVPYSSVVGSLMYAQVCTHPNIAFVVGVLGRYLSDPSQSHWKTAKKVLRYLQGNKDLMLTYRCTDTLEVVGFSDSDYVVCMDDKKSTSGYIFMMTEGAVSWKSVKQTLTTSSTMKAEYVAYYEASCHAIWLQNFISALEVVHSISRPLKLFYNNSAVISFSRNTGSISRSKHIDVNFFFVKKKVAESLISIEYTPTTTMLLDPLTKGLPIYELQEHVTCIGLLGA